MAFGIGARLGLGGGNIVQRGYVWLGLDDAALSKGLANSENQVQRSMRTMGKVAAGALGAIGIAAGKAVMDASNLGEQVNKVSVVFRGSEKDIIRWSKTLGERFGISARAGLEAAGVFGNMLVPMGFARDRAAEISKRMVQLAADMASFNNASPEETLDALRAGLAGETEPLRRFGIFLNAARVEEEALAQGVKKAYNEMSAQEKAAATLNIIMKDTKDTQGDFTRTSDSLANQQRILSAEFENVSAELGQALIPYMTRLITVLTDALAWTRDHREQVQTMAIVVGSAAAAVLGLNAALATYRAVVQAATVAQILFNTALRASPILIAVGAVTFLYYKLGLLDHTLGIVGGSMKDFLGITDQTKDSWDRARIAAEGYETAIESIEQANEDLRDGELRLEAAELALERAQKMRKQVVKEFGKDSLEYREAHLRVKQALEEVGDAEAAIMDAQERKRQGYQNEAKARKEADFQYRQLNEFYRNKLIPATHELFKTEEGTEAAHKSNADAIKEYTTKAEKLERQLRTKNLDTLADLVGASADYARELRKIPTKKEIEFIIHFRIPSGFSQVEDIRLGRSGDAYGPYLGALRRATALPNTGSATVTGAPRGDVTPGLWDELGIAAAFGLSISSTHRQGAITKTGNRSLHSFWPARAFDAYADPATMRAFAAAVYGRPGLTEVLYSGYGPTTSSHPVIRADHYDHVHVGAAYGDGMGVRDSRRRAHTGDSINPWRPWDFGISRRAWRKIPKAKRRRRLHQLDVASLPLRFQLAEARARLTPTLNDDITAARREVRWWERGRRTGWLSQRQRIDVLTNLFGAREDLQSLIDQRQEAADQIEAQAASVVEIQRGFLGEFASNIFSPSPGGLTFGTSPLGGNQEGGSGGVTVIQQFNRPPEDPHPLMASAEFAARTAFDH